jgi:hypothetical protein
MVMLGTTSARYEVFKPSVCVSSPKTQPDNNYTEIRRPSCSWLFHQIYHSVLSIAAFRLIPGGFGAEQCFPFELISTKWK